MSDPLRQSGPPPLFRPQPAAGGTSVAAGQKAAARVGSWRARILARLNDCPSCLWEVAQHFGVPDHCISGRFTELAADGYIEPTGERRIKPSTTCAAEVWQIRRARLDDPEFIEQFQDNQYPLTLRIDGDWYDRQTLLAGEGYPGMPYARRADTGGLRLAVRIELIECPGCGKPLHLVEQDGKKRFRCGSPRCGQTWRCTTATEPGKAPVLALVKEP